MTANIDPKDLRIAMAMVNPAFFAAEFLGVEIGPHHERWAELVMEHDQLDILAARGHGKSGFFSYVYPIWQGWRTPGNRGLIISQTEDQVAEFMEIIKVGKSYTDPETGWVWTLPALIDTELAYLVPRGYERTWTRKKIRFTNGSRIEARTFGKSSRGRHVRWMVVDDPHKDDVATSELLRNKDKAYLRRALEPMIMKGGQLIVVGTPLHDDDIHGENQKNPEWHCESFPAESEVDGVRTPLWASFRPLTYLDKRRRSMGELAYAQEYLLRPVAGESSLFPASLFRQRPETMATWLRLRPRQAELEARDWDYYAGVDIALSASAAADFFVVVVVGVDRHRNRHLVELVVSKGLDFTQQLKLVADTVQPYHAIDRLERVTVEANAAQQAWGNELRSKTDLPIRLHATGAERNSLLKGVLSLRPLIENGKFRFPRGDAYSVEMTDKAFAEFKAFGWLKGKLQGVGAHDDIVMALWLCDFGLRRGQAVDHELLEEMSSPEALGLAPIGDGAPTPLTPMLDVMTTHQLNTEFGKAEMVRAGYVPSSCTLPVEWAGSYVAAEVRAGRSPCWTCPHPRSVCRGAPRRMNMPENAALTSLREPRRESSNASLSPPEGWWLRLWVDTLEACAGDEHLARMVPKTQAERAEGWNALFSGSKSPPPWVALVLSAGKGDALYDALKRMLNIR